MLYISKISLFYKNIITPPIFITFTTFPRHTYSTNGIKLIFSDIEIKINNIKERIKGTNGGL